MDVSSNAVYLFVLFKGHIESVLETLCYAYIYFCHFQIDFMYRFYTINKNKIQKKYSCPIAVVSFSPHQNPWFLSNYAKSVKGILLYLGYIKCPLSKKMLNFYFYFFRQNTLISNKLVKVWNICYRSVYSPRMTILRRSIVYDFI